MRMAAMYLLHWLRIWQSVSSVSGSLPVANFMPFASSHRRTPCASSSLTCSISANSADWLSRSLKTPVACSSSSGMMALYIPMHPSSKIPMIALSRRKSCASLVPNSAAFGGTWNSPSAWTWLVSCFTVSPASHFLSPPRKYSSVKSSLHNVLYSIPAFVIEALRFNIPTRPGHCPLQFATVRIGP